MLERPKTLAQLPRYAARRFGDKIALRHNNRCYSFVELEAHISQTAGRLSALGVSPHQRVVLHLPNGWAWIVGYFAIARCGGVVVPVNSMLTAAEIAFVTQDSGAVAIIARAERVGQIDCALSRGHSVRLVGVSDGEAPDAAFDLPAPPKLNETLPDPMESDVSTIGYTSGTTGRPKGAVLSHRAVILNTAMTATLHVRTAQDVVLTALPSAHVYGNVIMNGAFLCGYELVLLERFDAELAVEAIERHRVTLFEGVPTMYYYLLGVSGLARRNLSSLTRATVGGQTIPISQLQAAEDLLGCPLIELWGMTEIAGLGTTHPAYGPAKPGSIGQALPYSHCRVVSLENPAKDASVGEPGELLFRGPTVMDGYFGRPESTAEALLPGGWLRTGDIAYADKEGYLFVVDRLKEMIITGGYNIYPSEVERVIATHPSVQMVAVGGIADAVKGELAVAYVVVKPGLQVDGQALLNHCKAELAPYKVPREVRFVGDLPKTSTGKIMRRALADQGSVAAAPGFVA